MRIIYCHHAEREVNPHKLRSQADDITANGFKDAQLVSEALSNQKVTAIYTSDFYRCKKTAQIINQAFGVPVYEEPRFNEVGSVEGEEWKACLERNIAAIRDILAKYNDDATIICVTSGVNLSAFICANLNQKPTNDFPFIGATNCAPIEFYFPTATEYREVKFVRDYKANEYHKNKNYVIMSPTKGELKTYLRYELRHQAELMDIFTKKARREDYLMKLGELERAQDLGEVETKKYLTNKIAIDAIQVIRDICGLENINFDSIQTTTALDLNEEQCIKNYTAYVERLFYIDTKTDETLMLIYSTLVSYINYNELSYEDVVKTTVHVEEQQGSFYNGKLIYRLK